MTTGRKGPFFFFFKLNIHFVVESEESEIDQLTSENIIERYLKDIFSIEITFSNILLYMR